MSINSYIGLMTSSIFKHVGLKGFAVNNVRTLYAPAALGIDGFLFAKEKIKSQFTNSVDKFKEKMTEFSQESNSMIFTEDLKNMIHLADNEKDLVLVNNMIRKFNSQGKEIRFGNYVFGPVVMRLFYHMNDYKTALSCFTEENGNGFFDQLVSYQILLDMLYNNGKYDEVIKTFEMIKSRQVQGGKYPKHVIVLVFASCYKQNTPESMDYALKLWKELNEVGHIPMRKAATFIGALILAQNAPHIALEIVSTIRQQSYVTVRNLRVKALADLHRSDDVIRVLKSVLEESSDSQTKHTFCDDVIKNLLSEFERLGNPGVLTEIQKIIKTFEKNGHISNNKLDDILCSEITATTQSAMTKDRRIMASSFTNKKGYNNRNRLGLKDLY